MPQPKIRAIVFDFGGVIELFEGGRISRNIAAALEVDLEKYRAVYFEHNHLSNVGNLKWDDLILKVAAMFTDDKEKIERVKDVIHNRHAQTRINTELLSFFKPLRDKGYKVAIFTNSNKERREKLAEQGILEMVDEVVISGEIGHQKPHKEAFQVLFERLGVRPEEVIFIDDTRKSLEKASEIGYVPILFTNNEQLRTDLKKYGISL